MKKGLLGTLLSVVFILAILFAGVYFYANVILGKAMEQALGTPVKVGRVALGLSEIGVHGLKIMSPEGPFQEKQMAELEKLNIEYDFGSLFSDTIHVKAINIDIGDLTVERAAGNKVNLLEIGAVKNRDGGEKPKDDGGSQSPSEEQPKESNTKPSKNIQIDLVTFDLGKMRYVDSSGGEAKVRELDLGIQNEQLKNVTDTKDVVKQIAQAIMKKVGVEVLKDQVSEKAGELKDKAGEAISGLLGKLKGKE